MQQDISKPVGTLVSQPRGQFEYPKHLQDGQQASQRDGQYVLTVDSQTIGQQGGQQVFQLPGQGGENQDMTDGENTPKATQDLASKAPGLAEVLDKNSDGAKRVTILVTDALHIQNSSCSTLSADPEAAQVAKQSFNHEGEYGAECQSESLIDGQSKPQNKLHVMQQAMAGTAQQQAVGIRFKTFNGNLESPNKLEQAVDLQSFVKSNDWNTFESVQDWAKTRVKAHSRSGVKVSARARGKASAQTRIQALAQAEGQALAQAVTQPASKVVPDVEQKQANKKARHALGRNRFDQAKRRSLSDFFDDMKSGRCSGLASLKAGHNVDLKAKAKCRPGGYFGGKVSSRASGQSKATLNGKQSALGYQSDSDFIVDTDSYVESDKSANSASANRAFTQPKGAKKQRTKNTKQVPFSKLSPFEQALALSAAPVQLKRISREESQDRLQLLLEEMFSTYHLVAFLWLCKRNYIKLDLVTLKGLQDEICNAQFKFSEARYLQNHVVGFGHLGY